MAACALARRYRQSERERNPVARANPGLAVLRAGNGLIGHPFRKRTYRNALSRTDERRAAERDRDVAAGALQIGAGERFRVEVANDRHRAGATVVNLDDLHDGATSRRIHAHGKPGCCSGRRHLGRLSGRA